MKPSVKFIRNFAGEIILARLGWVAGCALIATNSLTIFATESRIENEGAVTYVHPVSGRHLELAAVSGTNRFFGGVENAAGTVPFTGQTNTVGLTNSTTATLKVLEGDYNALVCRDHPVAFYPLNETNDSVAHDCVNGYHGTYLNSPALGGTGATTNTGLAVGLNGQYIDISSNYTGLNFSGQITLEAWIKPSIIDSGNIIAHDDDTGGWGQIYLQFQGSGSYGCGAYAAANTAQGQAVAPVPDGTLGNWVHVVGTYDGANWNLYQNGVLLGSAAVNGSGAAPINGDWSIGSGTGKVLGSYFHGSIQDVAIYNYALSSRQIQNHYLTGKYGVPIIVRQPPSPTGNAGGTAMLPLVENVAELRWLGNAGRQARCVAHLKGLVLAVGEDRQTFAFQDDTGAMLLEMKPCGRIVAPRQEINLEGDCVVEGNRALLQTLPVVDNDGIHTMAEKSGAIYLSAGKHPFRLEWFNYEVPYGLEVYFQGPGLPRQKIPDSALFRRIAGCSEWVNGLDYRCYEGNWLRVPDFDRLVPAKQGTAANFDTGVITRANYVGLQFTGYIEVPRGGIYHFTTISDDGSLLFIDEKPPAIEVTGTNALPDPVPITARQSLRADQHDHWSQVEGTVTFLSEQAGELELELSADAGRMRVEVADGSGASLQLLLNSRVRARGICLAARTMDGQSVAGTLLVPGMNQIEMLEAPTEQWSEHHIIPVGSLAGMKISPATQTIVHVRGKIRSDSHGRFFVEDGTGSVQVETPWLPSQTEGGEIELLGRLSRVKTNTVLQCIVCRKTAGGPREPSTALPILVTVEQIESLPRNEWQRGYPVKIRGVITAVLDSGFFIQDSTRSIYARWRPPTENDVPRVGDFWEIEGTTFAEFAPNIQVSRIIRLGTGTLPAPLHPAWEQLINGSLDTEYIEVQGIVTSVASDKVTLLTRAGKIGLELPDVQPQALRHYKEALVRIRGCVIPARDIHTQQVVPGQMSLVNASISLDEPPPANLFSIPLMHAADLLLFDLRAGALQRVKIAGQIVYEADGQLFLMDGRDGLRVLLKSTDGLQVGDLVEVVGFPDLGGPSPILREAVARRIGDAKLPDPVVLPPNPPLNRRYDATVMRVQARLSSISRDQSEQVLELQSGARGFVARLKTRAGLLPTIPPGSLLELTGVYAGQGSDLASGRDISSFELLLNSPADVQVLARPSWWTARHTLTVLGGMVLAILAALVWIALLHRQVEERSHLLAAEIRRHEHTQRQRELEEERARIARDLHDDLGSSLARISLLTGLARADREKPSDVETHVNKIAHFADDTVRSLEEIVWALRPGNDTVQGLLEYLAHFTNELFEDTSVRCRLDFPADRSARTLPPEVRHNIFLVMKEALTNVFQHASAEMVHLQVKVGSESLEFMVQDDGQGFNPEAIPAASTRDGLENMRQRAEVIGATLTVHSAPGKGSVVWLKVPFRTTASGA